MCGQKSQAVIHHPLLQKLHQSFPNTKLLTENPRCKVMLHIWACQCHNPKLGFWKGNKSYDEPAYSTTPGLTWVVVRLWACFCWLCCWFVVTLKKDQFWMDLCWSVAIYNIKVSETSVAVQDNVTSSETNYSLQAVNNFYAKPQCSFFFLNNKTETEYWTLSVNRHTFQYF